MLVRHSFDTRMFQAPGSDSRLFLGLVLRVDTSNEIDIPASALIAAGMDLTGRYVCRRGEPEDTSILPRLHTLGRVVGAEAGKLALADTSAEDRIDPSSVLLEPRQENLANVVRLFYPKDAGRILESLRQRRQPYVSASGKLNTITSTLNGIREKLPLVFGGGLTATIGVPIQAGDALFPSAITTSRPGFLFGAQGREAGQSPDQGIARFGPYKYTQHERNEPLIAVICERQYRGRVELFAEALRAGFDDGLWQEAVRRRTRPPENPFRGGLLAKFRLQRVQFEFEEVADVMPESYAGAIGRVLTRLPRRPDLGLVQTRKAFEALPADRNPYLVAKAAFMKAGICVQSAHIETMEMPHANLAYTLNNLALATYAKLGGLPFVMSTRTPATHELVVGLGYSEVGEGRFGPRSRYVGITTVFQGDGRYLVWGQTREVEFEGYAQALLENLRSTIRFVREENNWQRGDRVRLVVHVYKPLKHSEMDSIKAVVQDLISDQHAVEYAFLDVSQHHEVELYDLNQRGVTYYSPGTGPRLKGVGVPIRGQCRQLSARSAVLQLIGPHEVKTDYQGLPQPLLIELHPESDFTDLTYLVRQVFHFSYLSWRSFFPAIEPVTILYSRLIANALGNLRLVPGWQSQALTVGPLRDSMWFL